MSSLNLLDKLVDSDSFWTVGLDHFEENVEETPVFLLISHLSLKENGDSRNDDFLFFQDSYDRPVGSWQPSLPRFHDFAFYWGFLLHPQRNEGDNLKEGQSNGVDIRGVLVLP